MSMELEKHLVLNKYFLKLFGLDDFNELREKLKDVEEGYDSHGRSYFADFLIGLKGGWEDQLLRYDESIRRYVETLRKNRNQPNFNLKYFQYLAVLFTEIFLDRYYKDRHNFLNELNSFLKEFNNEKGTEITVFTEDDLKKLAFWMATGSGKTLIMHINYWQILKYSDKPWDNIILITPNEGLSKQHYDELKLSGIPCKLYDGNIDNLKTRNEEILVIEIHKLREEKKGEGVSVDISSFDGKNLVFIDEGHKGQKSEEQTWKGLREKIAKNGFIFEYSATFGQIIKFTSSGRPRGGKSNRMNIELYDEYSKAIIFDYSYKYFYMDGYGKDFYVYNIKAEKKGRREFYSEEQQNLLLTAGLLSFYEQLVIFEKNKEELREYHIEKPLQTFVGSKVTGKGLNSDVVRIIQFLDKIMRSENYLKEIVEKILSGQSGLIDDEGNDIFKGKFDLVREDSVEDIVEGISQNVFNGKGNLELYEIKNAEGEIGLKASTSEKYFGVINVGDVSSLKKLIEESEIELKEDHMSQSLFFGINENRSPINILIGSKKFVEGWNSWRVSNMGLINMGKGEGPQIIQLFGRGVRLKGKDYSLKREENPDYELKALQTLFIFGLNADYINSFLTAIENEEVHYEEIVIPIRFNNSEKWEGKIYTIKTKDDFDFLEHPVRLEADLDILDTIKLDLRPKITFAHGLRNEAVSTVVNRAVEISDEYLDLIDWDLIYSEVINHKTINGMFNLLIDVDVLREIINSRRYQIFMADAPGIAVERENGRPTLKITSFRGMEKFHEIVLMVLKDYMSKFYRKMEKRKMMDYLEVEKLTKESFSMFPENYEITLKIPKKLASDISSITEQLEGYNGDMVPDSWEKWDSFIVHLDNHLYTPLIIWKENKEEIKSIPVKLNEGETKFVEDLRDFLESRKDLFEDKDLFLLRNLSKKGVGFFLSAGFYPDFILWLKDGDKQYMVFVDPKGIRNLGNFKDEKIQLCKFIKRIEDRVNEDGSVDLQLDAFIVSVSEYSKIKKSWENGRFSEIDDKDALAEFEDHNILFQEHGDYIGKMFEKIGMEF